jgi:hypothetical protein
MSERIRSQPVGAPKLFLFGSAADRHPIRNLRCPLGLSSFRDRGSNRPLDQLLNRPKPVVQNTERSVTEQTGGSQMPLATKWLHLFPAQR